MNHRRDTSKSEVEALYLKSLRKMTGERRVEITSELFEAVKEIARAGIVHQNPGISEEDLEKALRKRIYR